MSEANNAIKSPSLMPAFAALFASSATLICCALPAALVALGMGAVMAGLISNVPQLIWLGEHKAIVFTIAALTLAGAGAWQWHARTLPCPIEPNAARACMAARRWGWRIWTSSVAVLVIGAFFAFAAVPVMDALGI
jgi:hypothetical protein